MTFPYGVPVTLIRRVKAPSADDYGNDVFTTSTSAVQGVFNPGGSSEAVQGQDVVTTQPTVYLPAGTDVAAIDAVEVAGQTFEVDGSPNAWLSPFTGWSPGVEVKLKGVTG